MDELTPEWIFNKKTIIGLLGKLGTRLKIFYLMTILALNIIGPINEYLNINIM